MNNLLFAGVSIGFITFALLAERATQQRAEFGRIELTSRVRAVELENEEVEALLTAGRAQLQRNRTTARTLAAELETGPNASSPIPMDAENEGTWPSSKPYFYLRKSLLPTAQFQRFRPTSAGLGVSADTAAILEMTPAEAVSVDEGFQELLSRYKKLEAERLALVSVEPAPRTKTSWPGTKWTYRLPALREEIEPVLEDYFAAVGNSIGNQREQIYQAWVKFCIADSFWDFGRNPRILSLTDEKVSAARKLTRFNMTEDAGKFLYYCELWDPPQESHLVDGDFGPRFPFRHLFGDNGQLRPGVAAPK